MPPRPPSPQSIRSGGAASPQWTVLVAGAPGSVVSAHARAIETLGVHPGLGWPGLQGPARLGDAILARMGRRWDDPPERGEVEDVLDELLDRFATDAQEELDAAFSTAAPARVLAGRSVSLLLPFWREVAGPRLAGVLAVADPDAAAGEVARSDGLSGVVSLALFERHLVSAADGLAGLPVFVSSNEKAAEETGRWADELTRFLSLLGIELAPRELVWEPSGRPQPEDSPLPVLSSQEELTRLLLREAGAHDAFRPPPLEESEWSRAVLSGRHDLTVTWDGLEWLGRQVGEQLMPASEETEHEPPFAENATDDEGRYHGWLRRRGEESHVASHAGTGPPATTPPEGPPLFSVLVPSYRTPLWALDRCVGSVLSQDEGSFELRIADDASGEPALVARLREVAALDPRITVLFAERNGGISRATNSAAAGARGEFLVFLDHDDELAGGALAALARVVRDHPGAALIYSDEDKIDESGRRHMPAFKPAWSPDLLLSNAYMCHLLVIRRDLFERLGGLRPDFDGAQDYDLMLRATEVLGEEEIVHIPEILYHWRTWEGSASGDPSQKPWAFEAGRRALEDAMARRSTPAEVSHHPRIPGSYHVARRPRRPSLVTAIIPFRDEPALLAACYRAFVADPGDVSFELLLVDNDSVLPETRAVRDALARDDRVRLLEAPGEFDWVKINNEAAEKARGDILLFLNNDIEARSPRWLWHMVAQAQREEVGAVGARLVFPDGTLQHGGIAVGVCWGAAHIQEGLAADKPGYLSSVSVVRDVSAVTGACLMTRRDLFSELGGFDRSLPVAFNDVDYCLRLRERGLLVVYTPLAELVHHESKSRGHTDDARELPYFRRRWGEILIAGDPYYSPNLGRFDTYCRLPSREDEEEWERWETFLSTLDE